jgi:hypothetical protein
MLNKHCVAQHCGGEPGCAVHVGRRLVRLLHCGEGQRVPGGDYHRLDTAVLPGAFVRMRTAQP